MSFDKGCCSSFANNSTLALCSPDGVLHIWDVATGEQKQQYLPTSHLTATFTCLSWRIALHRNKQKSASLKRKRTNASHVTDDNEEYIALGTAVGDVVLFNCLSGELVSKFSGGHSEQVNCISWKGSGDTFYSCSNDQNIVEWSMMNSTHKFKWKAEKREVYSIAVGPHSKTLLSAGKMIKLWDLKTKELLRRYAGHSTPVLSLSFVNTFGISTPQDATALESVDGLYFLSAALEDRVISAWQVKSLKHKKTSLCSFSLPSEPTTFDILPPNTQDSPFYLLSITLDGEVVIFSHTLNGNIKKPLTPTGTIKVATDDAVPLNIISATFKKDIADDGPIIIIAYGTPIRVAFELVNLKDHTTSDIVLIRKDPMKSNIFKEQDKTKLREPIKKKNVSSVVPGVVGHSGDKSTKKRKQQVSIGESQLTIEERLSALSVDAMPSSGDKAKPPRANSFAILLSQGLQSNDRDVLNQVLQHGNDALIENTVKQVPLGYIVPLVKELMTRLQGGPEKSLTFMKWMRVTLNHHASYLMTFPDVIPVLGELYQLLNIRTQTHGRLSRLEGKLDLIMSQVSTRKTDTTSSTEQQAMFVFEEESSDEQEDVLMDGLTIDHPDSFDEWDDWSDAGGKQEGDMTPGGENNDVLMNKDG